LRPHEGIVRITKLSALEILDSRGIPTVEVTIDTGTHHASASVPSGKSTGKYEARERRDGNRDRYGGRGVLQAILAVTDVIAPQLVGRALPEQAALDALLIALDGTPNKGRLGANAILPVSLAAARLRAAIQGLPLFESLGGISATHLPVPYLNVINGGAHADNGLEIQEFMIVPAGLPSFAEALRAAVETYHALAAILEGAHLSTAVGDEGGFAPAITDATEALGFLVHAITRAGYTPNVDIWIALDAAANEFYQNGGYHFHGKRRDAAEMTAVYEGWLNAYPILSIEDGLAEEDIAGWQYMTSTLGDRVQLIGDDIFVSDPARVRIGIDDRFATGVLLKPNQIGTLTEITETTRVAQAAGWSTMMSHRSGETSDPFIADLAVALGIGQIKAGAPARGERVSKYNQLLRIERILGDRASFAGLSAIRPPTRARRTRS
jgi:enolase